MRGVPGIPGLWGDERLGGGFYFRGTSSREVEEAISRTAVCWVHWAAFREVRRTKLMCAHAINDRIRDLCYDGVVSSRVCSADPLRTWPRNPEGKFICS